MDLSEARNLKEIYQGFLSKYSDHKAVLCFNGKEYTLKDLSNLIDQYTCHLKSLGIGQSMGVGYTLPNCPEVIALFFAVCRLGAYAVPVFPMTPDNVKIGIFQQSGAALLITSSGQLASIKTAAQQMNAKFAFALVDPSDEFYSLSSPAPEEQNAQVPDLNLRLPALMASSSGTTGIPKAVMMNHLNIISVIKASIALAGDVNRYGSEKYSSVMAFPLSTAGILVVSGMMLAGVRCVISADMSPVTFMKLVEHWRAESMAAPPSYFEAIINMPHINNLQRESVKNISTGMDFFSPGLMQRVREKFPQLDSFSNGYGLIETSNVFMIGQLQGEKLFGPTNELELVENIGNRISIRDKQGNELPQGEEGELWVKGPNVIEGYWNNPEATAQAFSDGWFKTGDIARQKAPGRIVLMGRNKYLIKRGGKSVSPLVVQNCINEVKGIVDSAVVGVPHELYGQMIWAFVKTELDEPEAEKNIMKHCRTHLPNYMLPDQIKFIDTIPKNPGVGKLNYENLIKLAKDELKTIQGV